MLILQSIVVSCLVFTPIYLQLAAYSLRYYASLDKVAESSIESFLSRIKPPLRGIFAEYSKYNLFIKDPSINISTYLKTDRNPQYFGRRIFYGTVAFLLIAAICVGFIKQRETLWRFEYAILFLIHVTCAIWAWRFGSKLAQIDNSLR